MNKAQLEFLEQLGERIPRLFEAIARGNVKSEFIVGVRTINSRQVRLKLVAEVVDPGSNPLATHGQALPLPQARARPCSASAESPGIGIANGELSAAAIDSCQTITNPGELSQSAVGKRRPRRR